MLRLTKTESIIVEALKTGPKSTIDIEQVVDHAKDFSEDYVKVMIFKINQKKKIIEAYNEKGMRMYRLIGEGIEYQILENISEALDELETLKYLACETCSHRASKATHRKVNYIIVGVASVFSVAVFFIGYYVGVGYGDITVEIPPELLHQIQGK